MTQKKLAQEMSECPPPPRSLDRWCLSKLGGRGPASRPGRLGYVLYLGNEACCALGWQSFPLPTPSKHRSLETREERGPSDPCTQGAVGVRLPPTHPSPPG